MMVEKVIMGVDNHETEFHHRCYAPGIYGITCPGFLPGPGRLPGWGYVISYVVVGKERALLIDTGFGNADLKTYIEEHITRQPLMVVNTHIHPDHSGGNGQFDVVYVGEHETDTEEGFHFYKVPGQRPACQAVLDGGDYRFAFLKDGEKIDLGQRILEVIEIPGHTPGSITFYDEETQLLISGDAVLKRVFYGSGIPFRTYREALVKAKQYPIVDILSAHWPNPIGADMIDRMIHLIDVFDHDRSEPANWDEPGIAGRDMRMFAMGGDDFDDPGFVAVSYFTDELEKIRC